MASVLIGNDRLYNDVFMYENSIIITVELTQYCTFDAVIITYVEYGVFYLIIVEFEIFVRNKITIV